MDKMEKLIARFAKRKVPLDESCTFAKLTTFGCGGRIRLTLFPISVRQLTYVARCLARHKIPHCFLGHGSNILASDDFYDGAVVVTSRVKDLSINGQYVVAACGVSSVKLCSELVKSGLDGGEFFGCLPATVGGATACNAGCFKQCVKQVVVGVTVLHNGRKKFLTNEQCKFAYRNSIFKNNAEYLILEVHMRFPKASPRQIQATLTEMRKVKFQTQPLSARSAGCVLYSDKGAVSKLVDQAGLKGFRIGGAEVSEKHAGFVINLDKATAKDIYLLIEYVKSTIAEKFGITPQTELCLINF